MPSITDKFGKASISTGYATATTVKTARTAGDLSVLACYDLSKFTTDTPVFFITYKKTTDPVTGEVTVTNQIGWKALVNPDNNTFTNLTLAPGYTDSGNAIGDFVEPIPTSYWSNSLVEGILTHANPDGTLKANAVTATSIDYASLPMGVLTQSSYGTGGGLVYSGTAEILFDTFISNGNTVITKPANGRMQIATAGYYSMTLNTQVSDGGGANTYSQWIEWSPDGTTWDRVTPLMKDIVSTNDRGASVSGIQYLPANSIVHGAVATSGTLRFSATRADSKYSFSLSITRVG